MIQYALRRNAVSLILSFAVLLMSYLCIEQSQTIASQRTLIRSLFQDSLELNAIKMQRIGNAMRH